MDFSPAKVMEIARAVAHNANFALFALVRREEGLALVIE